MGGVCAADGSCSCGQKRVEETEQKVTDDCDKVRMAAPELPATPETLRPQKAEDVQQEENRPPPVEASAATQRSSKGSSKDQKDKGPDLKRMEQELKAQFADRIEQGNRKGSGNLRLPNAAAKLKLNPAPSGSEGVSDESAFGCFNDGSAYSPSKQKYKPALAGMQPGSVAGRW
eukprot:gnl/TRDRNA2_/TRDRNA2_148806_c0_seq2.p1 gnl/TRDRNA2_/TRDRNA2_148806_c0~~gnl/TRDRNA2_/TRDRNA2_148806_c0_seq2.p1  ORF type:complete len:174 (-),score=39.03 gnl/TRDRNA2_/TRDRNA2_148806_c0_seq2:488-1009(-)